MHYIVAAAILLFVAYQLWTKRSLVAQAYRKFKADVKARRKKIEERRKAALVERMLNMSRNLSSLTADDLRDPDKVRDAIERS